MMIARMVISTVNWAPFKRLGRNCLKLEINFSMVFLNEMKRTTGLGLKWREAP
jgi:hypothetical protein